LTFLTPPQEEATAMRFVPLFVLVMLTVGAATAGAQETSSVRPKNLQVLPRDTPMADVLLRMDIMVEALGVQCGYCHRYEGPGNPANDFASDEKAPKNAARVMMRLDGVINGTLRTAMNKPADAVVKVRCITCHRGRPIPDAPSKTVSPKD
jgi:hypothetical protein